MSVQQQAIEVLIPAKRHIKVSGIGVQLIKSLWELALKSSHM